MEITQNKCNYNMTWFFSPIKSTDTIGALLADNNTATCYCRKALWTFFFHQVIPLVRRDSVVNLIGRWHSGNYNTITQYLSFFIHIIAVAVRSEEALWRRGPPVTYFCPTLDPPLCGSGWRTTTLVGDREYFIPTKFHKIHKAGLEKNGRMARYDNSTLEPSAQVS